MTGPRRVRVVTAAVLMAAVLVVAVLVINHRGAPKPMDADPAGLGSNAATSSPGAGGSASGVGRHWLSGAWLGSMPSTARAGELGTWRGSPLDLVTTYPEYQNWQQLGSTEWTIQVFDGFAGRLSYGLPLLPKDDSGSLGDVASGAHDDTFVAIAALLRKHHRDDSVIRIGLEANGDWFPWGIGHRSASGANDPAGFVAAYRHVSTVLHRELPRATMVFDIGCAHAMAGQHDRLDSLTALYPGDDVVDVIGCDHYDAGSLISRDDAGWQRVLRPPQAPGLADVVDFAVAHGKTFAVPEWGLTSRAHGGGGDNAYFITQMFSFFEANAAHLAYENYFNEGADYIACALWQPSEPGRPFGTSPQNPVAAEAYRTGLRSRRSG